MKNSVVRALMNQEGRQRGNVVSYLNRPIGRMSQELANTPMDPAYPADPALLNSMKMAPPMMSDEELDNRPLSRQAQALRAFFGLRRRN